ncbi:ribosome assembly RNA-binding protein YhbY [Gallaecimonas pentaromativorans]|uniref:RNA-binding protein n=1 Tax=Gallaecimonas pentaromativorans TaxID=584787 RepID=A0A3N1PBJ2_9GAMM|nr:ribosome assembly RNA-binding protein YhbY [Gallaecimonas pentaromativorans]MED5526599.1 ribosome assembly RNA-binding protein YhbY [Pseudomonadota bacterium]ROQ25933.1 RNA-binding protein [Gallaecimonas pentaromativorans]
MELTPKQRQHLKALAHPLKPVVLLGSNGLTEGVLAEIDQALEHHELIKVKVPTKERELKVAIFETISQQLSAAKVQMIGHMLVLYRPAKEPVIRLPR